MSKEFDVHFKLKFSDYFGGIEATTKEEAIEIAKKYLTNETGIEIVKINILNSLNELDFEFESGDVLEVGVDI